MVKVLLQLLALASAASAIWPIPATYTNGDSVLWISRDVKINYKAPGSYGKSSAVQDAITRAHDIIFKENFVPWKFHLRNTDFEPAAKGSKKYISSIDISVKDADSGSTYKPLAGQVSEAYTLSVTEAGKATITADTSIGALRALDTFTQLWYTHSQPGVGVYTNLAPVDIKDAPKFSHRGLNLDVSRNYYAPQDVLHTIDALAWNKFNRLHIHATDAQSWPLDIPSLPELSEKGAYKKGLSWTPAEFENIQAYGAARGVEVITEIDMPGHTSIIALAYPELITAYDIQPYNSTYAAEPPSGALKLNDSAVPEFLEKLFSDLLPRVHPYSAYFHTGGDEVAANDYLLEEGVKSNDSTVISGLLQKFLDRNHDQVRKLGLTPMVWEEMLLQWNLTLGKDVVVQTWQTDEAVLQTVNKGHKALVGNYEYWYLDCGAGQWLNFENGAPFQTYYPFADYCTPTKNWRLIYAYDPVGNIPADKHSLVLGGEVHMWSEQTDPVILDHMLWPRAGAAGEVLWSGRQDAQGQNRSQLDAAPRLAEMRERLVQRGVRAGPVQMIFCTQHNATECSTT
ncbi:MAG: hypothetical protein M4579_007440 [Chaenotheca gracillima]|nr:MAG: hypothetical protein M4579_007440 [Chaenotheca gracillima]